MAGKVTYNDFRGGILSEKMRRRVDLENYYSTASSIINAVPLRGGGLELRPGMRLNTPEKAIPEGSKLFTYTVGADESYLIVLSLSSFALSTGEKKDCGIIYIYSFDGDDLILVTSFYTYTSKTTGSEYYYSSEDQIAEAIASQNYECFVLAQRDNPPFVIKKQYGISGFSWGIIELVAETDYIETDDDGNITNQVDWDYTNENGDQLFTEGDFPAYCAFMGERLWFMSSYEHPYRIWVSRPYDIFNFQTEDYYSYEDETTTTTQYIEALSGYGATATSLTVTRYKEVTTTNEETGEETTETTSYQDDSYIYYKSTRTVSSDGYYTTVSGIALVDTDAWITSVNCDDYSTYMADLAPKYDLYDSEGNYANPKTEAVYYLETELLWEKQVTEDCAIQLDISSDRDETISWTGYTGHGMIIGTTSSEWYLPANFSATDYSITKIGSYGSSHFRACAYGADTLFYIQTGARRIRSISYDSDEGFVFLEPTYLADTLFEGDDKRIVEIKWQRVPTPRLYAVQEDGSVAVYSYDPQYGMQSWVIWASDEYSVLSISVLDDEDAGQRVVALVEDSEGETFLAEFVEGLLYDGEVPFSAQIVTNFVDSAQTMPSKKGNYSIYVDTMQSEFVAYQEGESVQTVRDFNSDMIRLELMTRPTRDGLRIVIESVEEKPFILLALIVEVEVG